MPEKLSFLSSPTIKLPEIDAALLEHYDDAWLDAAFEARLEASGEDLRTETTRRILDDLFGCGKPAASAERKGDDTVENTELSRYIPEFKDDGPIPNLPENADDEQLKTFAEAHPLVKKAKRILGAHIVSITKN